MARQQSSLVCVMVFRQLHRRDRCVGEEDSFSLVFRFHESLTQIPKHETQAGPATSLMALTKPSPETRGALARAVREAISFPATFSISGTPSLHSATSRDFIARALPIALEHCRCFAGFQATRRITSVRSLLRSFPFRPFECRTKVVWLFCRPVVRVLPGSMICDVEDLENLGYFFADDGFYSLS